MPLPRISFDPAPPGAPALMPVRSGGIPADYAAAAEAERFTGEAETQLLALAPAPCLLAGVGDEPNARAMEIAGALGAASLLRHETVSLRVDDSWRPGLAASFAFGAALRAWRYAAATDGRVHITENRDDTPRLVTLHLPPVLAQKWARRQAILDGVSLARALVTEPSNTKTPQGFLRALTPLVEAGCTLEVIEGAALAPFGCLSAVGQASAHPPALAVLRWPGTLKAASVAFVGKGITFDTGGICIKPADRIWEMRADMAGAAACAGAMLALARLGAAAPAMAVLALAENAIGAEAYRPGDVLHAYNGLTVEVIDTDAEGRLALADALAWTATQKPRAMIDLATLTGSIVVALGHQRAGLFSTAADLAAGIAAAGSREAEPVWQMPLTPGYRKALDSAIADLRHCSPQTRQPDACHAAAFLREFVGDIPWAHVDIAGVESWDDDPVWGSGATGFGVRLLTRLVLDRYSDDERG